MSSASKRTRLLAIALGGPKGPKSKRPMEEDYGDEEKDPAVDDSEPDDQAGQARDQEEDGGDDDEEMQPDDGSDLSESQVRCAHDAMAALSAGDAHAFGEAVLALVKDADDASPGQDDEQDEDDSHSEE